MAKGKAKATAGDDPRPVCPGCGRRFTPAAPVKGHKAPKYCQPDCGLVTRRQSAYAVVGPADDPDFARRSRAGFAGAESKRAAADGDD